MKLKNELNFEDYHGRGGKYVSCENPKCPNAYHYMEEVSYSILHQERPDGLIIDLSLCSLECLLEVEPIKETLGVPTKEDSQ